MFNKLNTFLKENFEGFNLNPPLFYSWQKGIRFEISPPFPHSEKELIEQAFDRSIFLFKKVFEENDDILLVTDVKTGRNDNYLQRRPLNVYRKYSKINRKLFHLQHQILEYDVNDEEEKIIHRFILSCKKSEIRYAQLLKAICHEDLVHPSTILKNNPQSGYEIYFVNLTKKIIFHLYDDRGCDILAADKETIRYLYDDCTDWILDYDRNEIVLMYK